MTAKPIHPTRIADQLLRAVALVMVLTIHFMSSIHVSPYVSAAPHQFWAVLIDQICRVSVPLFVALSGYGLSQKYTVSNFHWSEFLKNRVLKLLPLYIGWSIFYYFSLRLVPYWKPNWQSSSLLEQLLWGEADYQMYFVPMIFQLYVLFPALLALRKKWPWPTFIFALVLQATSYWFYQQKSLHMSINWTDQLQYIFFGAWIFYFVLGMYLRTVLVRLQKKRMYQFLLIGVAVITGFLMVRNALYNINTGFDPVDALRTTRFSVLAYASTVIVMGMWLATKVKKIPWIIEQIGIHSYNIYLGHTFFLRVLFTFWFTK
jgi:surface polysaccharide O-acyltransferase-like enzyme